MTARSHNLAQPNHVVAQLDAVVLLVHAGQGRQDLDLHTDNRGRAGWGARKRLSRAAALAVDDAMRGTLSWQLSRRLAGCSQAPTSRMAVMGKPSFSLSILIFLAATFSLVCRSVAR